MWADPAGPSTAWAVTGEGWPQGAKDSDDETGPHGPAKLKVPLIQS
jgi:hypothetical protein